MRSAAFRSLAYAARAVVLIASTVGLFGCTASSSRKQFVLAERLFNNHQYADSVEEFNKVASADSRGSLGQTALYRVATIQYLYLQRYSDSISSFKQFITVSTNEELTLVAERSIAEIYADRLEQCPMAVAQYRRMLEKYKLESEADAIHLKISKCFVENLKFEDARKELKIVIDKSLNETSKEEAQYQYANTFVVEGELSKAEATLKEFISEHKTSPLRVLAEFGLANVFEERERWAEAKALYQQIEEKHPSRDLIKAKVAKMDERLRKAEKFRQAN